MCGIAGFIEPLIPAREAKEQLSRMLATIVHRGPDGEGSHYADGIAMGMRRLSIIDIAGGRQPMWNEDQTIAVVFNGEIYNYRELTLELAGVGHTFRTHSDTEVLVHGYEEYGEALLNRLRGMFAFAILDTRKREIFIARDHFGQKPLYYASAGSRFAFASELKSLFALPWVNKERDPDALLDYVGWLSLPSPRTHFRHITKLPAGSIVRLSLDDPANIRIHRYWHYQLDHAPELTSMDEAVEALDRTLRDSVALHLRADVPVGVLLSSGLDSRLVSAYAQELQDDQMQTFTVGFGGEDSEAHAAAKTAREIRSVHHSVDLSATDLAESLGRIAWHLDEPIGDPAAFAVLRICEHARQHVKVLLSGEGADELFGGYDSRYLGIRSTLERSDRLRRLAPILPKMDAACSSGRWRRLCMRAHHTRGSEAVSLRMEGLPGDVRHPRGLTAAQRRSLRARMNLLASESYRPQRDILSELLALDLGWQLAESLLQKADKMSMGASIELRTPLLDLEVAQLAARMDSRLKLPPKGPGKLVLRQCLARKLAEPLTRPKRGFPVPLHRWFSGPLRAEVEETLFSRNAQTLEILDRRLLREAWNDFLQGTWDGGRIFYSLWLYETWARTLPQ